MKYNYWADAALLKDRKSRVPKYKIVNKQDENREILLKQAGREDAVFEALQVLGWSFVRYYEEQERQVTNDAH